MRDRPLCSICLVIWMLCLLCVHIGGAKFVRELRPSLLEQEVQADKAIQLEGRVYKKETKEKYQILYLKTDVGKGRFKESVIVYDEHMTNLSIGNIIRVKGHVKSFSEPRNPGNFNQKLYYQKQGIHVGIWASTMDIVSMRKSWLKEGLYQLRQRWKQELETLAGKENGPILAAMILGEKSEMDTQVKELYQSGGIGHLIAISGLHLSIVGVGIYQLLRRLTGSYTAGGIAGSLFLLLYILMIGFTVSVIRAFVMFLFRVGADMAGRKYDSLTALGAAAVVTVLWQPLCIYEGGFWMSFLSVFALIVILPVFEKLFEIEHAMKLVAALRVSLCIQMVLLPVQMYFFYEIPLYAPILNLIVIPLISILLCLGMLGSAGCMLLPVMEGVVHNSGFRICAGILWLYRRLCEKALLLPGARIVTGRPEMWQVWVYYGILAIVLIGGSLICRKQKKTVKKAVCLAVLMLSVCMLTHRFGERGVMQVTMLDIGQGDCIFFRSPGGQTCLADGGSSDVKKVGEYRIEPFLMSGGVGKLDYVFVSHGDEDHISGIRELLERQNLGVRIKTLVLPDQSVWDEHLKELAELADHTGTRVAVMEQGGQITENSSQGLFRIACLAPAHPYEGEIGNASSMVLDVSCGAFDLLLTGDVEGEGETFLTEYIKSLGKTYDVLKVAHHGSKNSTTEEFLQQVRPRYALISAGIDNRYRHPHEETIKRLEGAGAHILQTKASGAITIKVKGDKMKIDIFLP